MLSAVLAVAVAAAPLDAGSAPPRFEWNVPGVDKVSQVGDALETNGLPLKVFLAHSKLSHAELVRHYFERFTRLGFYIDRQQKPLPGLTLARLTALDERTLWSYTVIFYPEANGSTTVVLGAADLAGRKKPEDAAAVGLPVLPGARRVLTSNVEFARSVSFETDQSADEVLTYYQSTLPTLGWKEREKGVFVRGRDRARVLTRSTGPTLQVVLLADPDLALPGPEALGSPTSP